MTICIYVCVVVGLLYFVPAGLYCAYNNLGFVNLQHFDPTTYFLLLQFRVVVTGVIFQVIYFEKLVRIIMLESACVLRDRSVPGALLPGWCQSALSLLACLTKM